MRIRPERRRTPWSDTLDPRQLPSGLPIGPAPEVGPALPQPYPGSDTPLVEPLDRDTGVDVDVDLLGIPRESEPEPAPHLEYSPAGDYPTPEPGVIYT